MAVPVEDNDVVRDKRQLCFEVTKSTYDFSITDIDGLDAKASNLITFVGVILGIYSSFGLSIISSIDKTKFLFNNVTYYNLSLVISIVSLALLLISIYCALRAYKLYNMTIVPDPTYFYEQYVVNDGCTKDMILDNLTVAYVSAFQLNDKKRGDKSFFISLSFILLLTGSIAGVIFLIIILLSPKV
jgi:hypothetical protein